MSHAYSFGQTLHMHIGSVFGTNVSPHNWEVFAHSLFKLAEHLHSSRDLPTIVHKHRAIVELIKIPKDIEKCPHLMVQATTDSINEGVNANGNRGPTKKAIFVDNNLLAGIWVRLKPDLACSVEALHVLLDNPESHLRRSLLCMEIFFKTTCSCVRTQLVTCIKTMDLTLIITDTKHVDLVTIMWTTWNSSRKIFTLREVASLLGIAPNLSLTT